VHGEVRVGPPLPHPPSPTHPPSLPPSLQVALLALEKTRGVEVGGWSQDPTLLETSLGLEVSLSNI
jgi:hypothetical protein